MYKVILLLIVIDFGEFSPTKSNSEQLLILSFDGFRFDYFDKFERELRALKNITKSGVHARNGIESVFSTKTFPAHWSIATGLYEESHGIISNKFYDPISNSTFKKT